MGHALGVRWGCTWCRTAHPPPLVSQAAIMSSAPWSSMTEEQALASALLCLDTTATLGNLPEVSMQAPVDRGKDFTTNVSPLSHT